VQVTTGGGFDMAEIDPFMLASIVDLENPLPSNATGVEQLNSALAQIVQAPVAQAVAPAPDIASQVSGRTFRFEQNAVQILSAGLDFEAPERATFQMKVSGDPEVRVGSVGLDGIFRTSTAGRPWLARGGWQEDRRFLIEYNEGPGLAYYLIYLQFDGKHLTFELQSPASGQSWVLEGTSE